MHVAHLSTSSLECQVRAEEGWDMQVAEATS